MVKAAVEKTEKNTKEALSNDVNESFQTVVLSTWEIIYILHTLCHKIKELFNDPDHRKQLMINVVIFST